MTCKIKNKDIVINLPECFNAEYTLFCGQAFRWKKTGENTFHGITAGTVADIEINEKEMIFRNTDEETFNSVWKKYFDLDTDYAHIVKGFGNDPCLKKAAEEYYGIRILRQDSFEALISFIISQNNNIPRIMGIIERLCENFGTKIGEDYAFPTLEQLKNITVEDLAPLRAGFRSKYIVDAVQKVTSGEVCLEEIEKMPIEQARQTLMKIKGVGAKVAECTLLYGFGRKEAFPVDVWVKRIMQELYGGGMPQCESEHLGIAQQYLFHWRRNIKE